VDARRTAAWNKIEDALCPPRSCGPTAKHCGFAVTALMPRPVGGFCLNLNRIESGISHNRRRCWAVSGPIGTIGPAGPPSEADSNRSFNLNRQLPNSFLWFKLPFIWKYLFLFSRFIQPSAERPPEAGDAALHHIVFHGCGIRIRSGISGGNSPGASQRRRPGRRWWSRS